jgi:hypothetical protein
VNCYKFWSWSGAGAVAGRPRLQRCTATTLLVWVNLHDRVQVLIVKLNITSDAVSILAGRHQQQSTASGVESPPEVGAGRAQLHKKYVDVISTRAGCAGPYHPFATSAALNNLLKGKDTFKNSGADWPQSLRVRLWGHA